MILPDIRVIYYSSVLLYKLGEMYLYSIINKNKQGFRNGNYSKNDITLKHKDIWKKGRQIWSLLKKRC